MKKNILLVLLILFYACKNSGKINKATNDQPVSNELPLPYATKSVQNFSKVIGWKDGQTPLAPAGFTVTKFAEGLDHPRWIYVAGNGDIFIAESNTVLKGIKKIGASISRKIKTQNVGESADRITLFRDSNKDGIPDNRFVFAENLNQPFGMLILGDHFYVGNTDALMEFDYTLGDTALKGGGKMIVTLPAGKFNRHWARNIIASRTGDKIYIAVGSGTNVAEKGLDNEIRRADILEVNPDGSGERIYASGLRNPAGMGWAPGTNTLWTAVNERDELGDELVPDYITSVQEGGFYGWPFAYYGKHEDPRMASQQRPDLVRQTITPDVSLGAHTASLGLAFYTSTQFPSLYHDGVFVAQHGSWNRSALAGYKVVFIPFINGKPLGIPQDFLTGFAVTGSTDSEVRGRPVDVAVLADGSMLVTDDVSDIVWRVSYHK
jgi:glucose/arabinose dehydrogenase